MKKLMVLSLAGVMAAMTGCVSVNQSDGGTVFVPSVAPESYETKYDVKQQVVKAEDNVNVLFGIFSWGSTATHVADNVEAPGFSFIPSSKEIAKNGAFANACDAAKADSILAARYKVTTKDYFVFKKVHCEVIGFPANLTGIERVGK